MSTAVRAATPATPGRVGGENVVHMLRVDASVRQHFRELLSQLRSARKDAGLPQRSLAAKLDVSNTSLADWEAGKDDPTMAHLIQWATVLGFRLAIVDPHHSPAVSAVDLDDDESWEQHEMRRLAAALWTRRRSRKMSQAALAKRVGVGRISMQRWESVQVYPRPIAFLAWVGALECSVTLAPRDGADVPAPDPPRVRAAENHACAATGTRRRTTAAIRIHRPG